jgi:hypothetical protein
MIAQLRQTVQQPTAAADGRILRLQQPSAKRAPSLRKQRQSADLDLTRDLAKRRLQRILHFVVRVFADVSEETEVDTAPVRVADRETRSQKDG